MHRFIIDIPLTHNPLEVLDHTLVHQIERVLKISPGEQVVLCDGVGHEVVATLSTCTRTACVFVPTESPRERVLQKRTTIVYLSILKNENFELAVEKAVEVGVAKIVPIISARTIKKSINKERIKKIIKEATEQSNRTRLAELSAIVTLQEALDVAEGEKLFFDMSGPMVGSLAGKSRASIFIGPEGGWTPEEVELARSRGCQIVSMSSTVLRAETAAIVASYIAAQS